MLAPEVMGSRTGDQRLLQGANELDGRGQSVESGEEWVWR
jgi:hypothetical protein